MPNDIVLTSRFTNNNLDVFAMMTVASLEPRTVYFKFTLPSGIFALAGVLEGEALLAAGETSVAGITLPASGQQSGRSISVVTVEARAYVDRTGIGILIGTDSKPFEELLTIAQRVQS